jgi:hypothetical protein
MVRSDRPAHRAEVRALLNGKTRVTLIPPTSGRIACASLHGAHCVFGWHDGVVETYRPIVSTFREIHFASLREMDRAGYGHVVGLDGFHVSPELFED